MQLVVDASALFSAFVSTGQSPNLFFREDMEWFVPEWLLDEVNKYKMELLDKSFLSDNDFNSLIELIMSEIIIVPFERFGSKYPLALSLLSDSKDAPYLALALELNCPVWSNDPHFKQQSKVKVFTTEELIKLLG